MPDRKFIHHQLQETKRLTDDGIQFCKMGFCRSCKTKKTIHAAVAGTTIQMEGEVFGRSGQHFGEGAPDGRRRDPMKPHQGQMMGKDGVQCWDTS